MTVSASEHPSTIPYARALDLLWAGHRVIDPVYQQDGGIVSTFGVYRAAMNPLGQLALLYAGDPHDIVVDYMKPHGTPPHSIALDTLYPGLRWQGDTRHADAVTVIHARQKRTREPWVLAEIARFEDMRAHDAINYGFLKRVSETRWVSQAITYDLLKNQRTGLYTLNCTLAPAKGWNLLSLQGWQTKLVGLTAMSKSGLTMEEATHLITKDFQQRVRCVMRGLDHFDEPREITSTFEHVTLLGLVKRYVRRKGIVWTHGLSAIQMRDLLTALPALLVMVPFKGVMVALTGLSKLLGLAFEKSSKDLSNTRDQDISNLFWQRGITARKIPDQYEPIDPKILQRLRFLDQVELDNLPKHGGITQRLIEDTTGRSLKDIQAIEYILGTLHGPPGSVVEFFDDGAAQPRLIITQPNGLTIEHFPMIGCTFVRLNPDDVQDVPSMVADLFSDQPGKTLLIDDHSETDFYHGTFSKVKTLFLDDHDVATTRVQLMAIPLQESVLTGSMGLDEYDDYKALYPSGAKSSSTDSLKGLSEAVKALAEELPALKK